MDKLSSTLLRVLTNRFHGSDSSAVYRYLQDDDVAAVNALDIEAVNPSFIWRSPAEWLDRLHYSWLAPAISSFSKEWQPSLVATLTTGQGASLRQMLQIEKVGLPNSLIRRYLQRLLFNTLELHEAPPLELVPDSPFSLLTRWNKQQLVTLLDLLSMHDLKEKIRFIVDRKRLHEIYSSLDKEKLDFLRHIMSQRERLTSSELKLEGWQGDKQELIRLLHYRGLVRLGTALTGEHPSLLWHITHILDTGRSGLIMRYCQSGAPPHVVQLLAQQVTAIIEYIEETAKDRE